MLTLTSISIPIHTNCTIQRGFRVHSDGFPSLLPKEVDNIKVADYGKEFHRERGKRWDDCCICSGKRSIKKTNATEIKSKP
jgi:hypothetical protein